MPCASTGLAVAVAVGGWPLILAGALVFCIGVFLGALLSAGTAGGT